jgi:GntR family transcriptional regulator
VSLYNTLQSRFHIQIEEGLRVITADVCSEEEAGLLGILPNSPMLVLATTSFDVDGNVVDYGVARQRGDKAEVRDRLS